MLFDIFIIIATGSLLWIWLHLFKEETNNFLDLYAPKWYPECRFCRGIHFGILISVILLTLVYAMFIKE